MPQNHPKRWSRRPVPHLSGYIHLGPPGPPRPKKLRFPRSSKITPNGKMALSSARTEDFDAERTHGHAQNTNIMALSSARTEDVDAERTHEHAQNTNIKRNDPKNDEFWAQNTPRCKLPTRDGLRAITPLGNLATLIGNRPPLLPRPCAGNGSTIAGHRQVYPSMSKCLKTTSEPNPCCLQNDLGSLQRVLSVCWRRPASDTADLGNKPDLIGRKLWAWMSKSVGFRPFRTLFSRAPLCLLIKCQNAKNVL